MRSLGATGENHDVLGRECAVNNRASCSVRALVFVGMVVAGLLWSSMRLSYAGTLDPSQVPDYFAQPPDAVTLMRGYYKDFSTLVEKMKKTQAYSDVESTANALLKSTPLLVVPSGGFFGLDNSAFFKALLDEYVKRGGTLVVFSQQHGSWLDLVPGGVKGYGWLEDQSCQFASSFMEQPHPILAGQTKARPDHNVDGYLTDYPANTTVILRRMANGQPDLITYPYGSGQVVVTTIYSDVAFSLNQITADEKALLRDLLTWGRKPAAIPMIKQGESVSVQAEIVNRSPFAAATAHVVVSDPDRSAILLTQDVPVALGGGGTVTVPVGVSVPANAAVGIYHVDYLLFDAAGLLVQARTEADSGRFAVTNFPTEFVQRPDFGFSIQSDAEYYRIGTPATFTFNIFNNTDSDRTFKVTWGLPHHVHWNFYDTYQNTVTVQARSTGTFVHTLQAVQDLDRLRAIFYDVTSGQPVEVARRDKGIYAVRPAVKATVSTDKPSYDFGDTAVIRIDATNVDPVSYSATIRVTMTDAAGAVLFGDQFAGIELVPGGSISRDFFVPIPAQAAPGTCIVRALVSDNLGLLGGGSSSFTLPVQVLSIVPPSLALFGSSTAVDFQVISVGFGTVSNVVLTTRVVAGSDGSVIWEASQPVPVLSPGSSVTVPVSVPLSNPSFGTYKLAYRLTYGNGKVSEGQVPISVRKDIGIQLDKTEYHIRQTLGVSARITNTGNFIADETLRFQIPDLGVDVSQPVTGLQPGQSVDVPFSFPIPATLPSGVHAMTVSLALPSGSTVEKQGSFFVPPVKLSLSQGQTTFTAGDTVTVTASNTGGVDAAVSYAISLIDDAGNMAQQTAGTGTILSDGTADYALALSGQLRSGSYVLRARLAGAEGVSASLDRPIQISGTSTTLQVRTDRERYLTTDSITALADLANGSLPLSGALLDLQIVRRASGVGKTLSKVYVVDQGERLVKAFAPDGQLLYQWGNAFGVEDSLGDPRHVALDGKGFAYVTDHGRGRIVKFTTNGGYVAEIGVWDGTYPVPPGQVQAPDGIVSDGTFLYIVDQWEGWINKFAADGTFVTRWLGAEGWNLSGIAYDGIGSLYVLAQTEGGGEIHKFDTNGNLQASTVRDNVWPTAIAADATSVYVYTPWGTNERVSASLDALISSWSSPYGGNRDLSSPVGVAIDSTTGQVYISDSGSGEFVGPRVDIVTADGTFVREFACGQLLASASLLHFASLGSAESEGRLVPAVFSSAGLEDPGPFLDGVRSGRFKNPFLRVAAAVACQLTTPWGIALEYSYSGTGTTEDTVLWQTTLPVDMAASAVQQLSAVAGTLGGLTGKFYLKGRLASNIGQELAKSEYPFYVDTAQTVLSLAFDRAAYKLGDTATLAGQVENRTGVDAVDVNIVIDLTTPSGTTSLLNETVAIPAGGTYPIALSLTADTEGLLALQARVVQSGTLVAEVRESARVVVPTVDAFLSAPSLVGGDPFPVSLVVSNPTPVPLTVNYALQGGSLNLAGTWTLSPGQTQVVEGNLQIAQDTVITAAFSGDVTQTVTQTVQFGEGLSLSLAAAPSYAEGAISLPFTVTNTRQIARTIPVEIQVLKDGTLLSGETRTYSLGSGQSVQDLLSLNVSAGAYQVRLQSARPATSAQAGFGVVQPRAVTMTTALGAQQNGAFPLSVQVENKGFDAFSGRVIVQSDIWSQESAVSLAALTGSRNLAFSIDPSAAAPGTYDLAVRLLDGAGLVVAEDHHTLVVSKATFQLIQVPQGAVIPAGQGGTLSFRVRNTGNQEGTVNLSLRTLDLADETRLVRIAPGAEESVDFLIAVPADIEDGDYPAAYSLASTTQPSEMLVSGRFSYHVSGAKIGVNAYLDRRTYSPGDTAVLTLAISPQTAVLGQAAFVRVKYADFEAQQSFVIDGPRTLSFNVPLPQITGEALFYGIYFDTGRSLYLSSIPVRLADGALSVLTDKDVYRPGETVQLSISAAQAGQIRLAAPGYAETFAISGTATRSFVLPTPLRSGTYQVSYELAPSQGDKVSGSTPFGVDGIHVRVLSATTDRPRYNATDTINARFIFLSNTDFSGILRILLLDPKEKKAELHEQTVSFARDGETVVEASFGFSTTLAGIHYLLYGIYDASEVFLTSASKAFDVGNGYLAGLVTDRLDYPAGNEPVAAIAGLMGQTSGNIEIFLDGVSLGTKPVAVSGVTEDTTALPAVNPGLHALKGVFTADDLTSERETRFSYGSALPDLVVQVASGPLTPTTLQQMVAVAVTNQGRSASEPTTVALYTDDPAKGGVLIGEQAVPALAAGATATATFTWNFARMAGLHSLTAVVDPSGLVKEFREDNNRASFSVVVPKLGLSVETAKPSYAANEDAVISSALVNLTADVSYDNLVLRLQVRGPDGSVLSDQSQSVGNLPAGDQKSISGLWNTGSTPPGPLKLAASLLQGTSVLAAAESGFSISPSVQISGSASLVPGDVPQGASLRTDVTTTNRGNVAAEPGRLVVSFLAKPNLEVVRSLEVPLAGMAVLQTVSSSATLDPVDLAPGLYQVSVAAVIGGQTFLVAVRDLKVLQPLRADQEIDKTPRVLIWVNGKGRGEDDRHGEGGHDRHDDKGEGSNCEDLDSAGAWDLAVARDAVRSIEGAVRIVCSEKAFKEGLRSGLFNLHVLLGGGSEDHEILEELAARIFAGDGVVIAGVKDSGEGVLQSLAGGIWEGFLPAKPRDLVLTPSAISPGEALGIDGKVNRITDVVPLASVLGTTSDHGKAVPALILNPYGEGRSVFMAFDLGTSALAVQSAVPYGDLLRRVLALVMPLRVDLLPAGVAPVGTTAASLGGTFDLRVVETMDPALRIVHATAGLPLDERQIEWTLHLDPGQSQTQRLYLRLPAAAGTYPVTTEVWSAVGGSERLAASLELPIGVPLGLSGLSTLVGQQLALLQSSGGESGRRLAEARRLFDRVLARSTASALSVEESIEDLAKISRLLDAVNGSRDARVEIGRLMIAYEGLWSYLTRREE